MYHFWPWMSKVKVNRWPNVLYIKMTITQSILELEHRLKAHDVGNKRGYYGVWLNFRYNFRFKRSPEPQNGGHFENFKIFIIGLFWHQIWKHCHKLSKKKYFWCWWRHWWCHRRSSKSLLFIHCSFRVCPNWHSRGHNSLKNDSMSMDITA